MSVISMLKKKVTRIIGIDPAPENCGFVFMERTKIEGQKGFEVLSRFTIRVGSKEEAKGNSDYYWAKQTVSQLLDGLRSWFDQADKVVIERQFTPPNAFHRLPSYYVQAALIPALIARYGNDKVELVDARSIKSVYFKQDEKETYEKRKSTAEDLCRDELLKAPVFRPDDRLHDQADAYLVACYWYNHVYKTPQIRNFPKPGRPRKIQEESETPTDTEEYVPEPEKKRGRKRKLKTQ